MNVRLKDELSFTAGVYYDNQVLMNNYQVRVNMTTNSSDSRYVNVARDRMLWFLRGALQSSIFIKNENQTKWEEFAQVGLTVTTFPEEPVDQIVGLMLYCKLNAIMEKHITVTDIEVSSEIGDGCWYPHSQSESVGPFNNDGWWNSGEPTQSDRLANKNKRVVKLYNSTNWHDLELSWPADDEDISDNVVIKSFTPKTDEN
jgi:hypothetical protein